MRAFRFRAYPSELQMSFLRQVGGCTRLVRNLALEQRRAACGQVNAQSRVSRDRFRCVACGHARHADWNAALVVLGGDDITPEDIYSGSACGALCSNTATKQEIQSAKTRNHGLQAGE